MPDIYIISDYGSLRKENETFKFTYPDGTVSTFFPHNTEKILIIGRIEITADALRMMMRHNIEAVFIGRNGRFDGRLVCGEGKNVFIRRDQYRRLDDATFTLSLCKSIVAGKIKNQISFTRRIGRERGAADADRAAVSMRGLLESLDKASTIDQVRGCEGAASRAYFSVFRHNIIPAWARFTGRRMNPPGDNVNAVMSFVYTLMNYSVESAIAAEGLDPYAGYLHVPEYGRKSLIFDLMEEYRVPVCDTLTSSVFNLGIIKEDEFEDVVFSGDDDDNPLGTQPSSEDGEDGPVPRRKGVLMKKSSLKKVIDQFEKRFESRYHYLPADGTITLRRLVHEQVKHFKRVISGEESHYRPFVIK
ncbi:MAG TPA: CRISPR-associated endonuclease Cas1 [Spirochaetota bacterium]|nr:CRISPR-associated endonuclease Cas1 [Spirochaetota bacterium]